MFPLMIPSLLSVLLVGTGALAAYWLWKLRAQGSIAHGTLTPERQVIYEMAIEHLRDAKSLRSIADEFERQGLPTVALRLRKRADVQELPQAKKDERRDIYKKARKSTNVEAILAVAKVFDEDGSPGAAYSLRSYAEGIRVALRAEEDTTSFPPTNDFAGEPPQPPQPPTASFGGRKRKRNRGGGGRAQTVARVAPPAPRASTSEAADDTSGDDADATQATPDAVGA